MTPGTQLSMQVLQRSQLALVVAQVIDNPHIDQLDWEVHSVSGVGGSVVSGGRGLFRLIGFAEAAGQTYPWSVIVKIVSGSNSTDDPNDAVQTPSAWNYWKRELLAYRSGLLRELSGNLIAPRCYDITEHPNDEWRIWLEDIQEIPKAWTMERHSIAARHLGQFNGAYLMGRALPPEQPWMYRGRARDWIKLCPPMLEKFQQYARSDSGRRWLTARSVERVERLLANYQSLLPLLDKLPTCLCHHDGFRRNLLAVDRVNTKAQTVAIDWSMIGYGGVGEEIGITTSVGLSWLDVAGDKAKEMDISTFESYVDGLRDCGWQGDIRLARFGYAATASLVTGVTWAMYMGGALSTDEGARGLELMIGHKIDDLLEQWAMIQPFLLDLGDEALRLADELA